MKKISVQDYHRPNRNKYRHIEEYASKFIKGTDAEIDHYTHDLLVEFYMYADVNFVGETKLYKVWNDWHETVKNDDYSRVPEWYRPRLFDFNQYIRFIEFCQEEEEAYEKELKKREYETKVAIKYKTKSRYSNRCGGGGDDTEVLDKIRRLNNDVDTIGYKVFRG